MPVVFTPALALSGVNATGTLSISGDPSARYKLGDNSLTSSDTQVGDVNKAVEVQVTTSTTAGASVKATLSIAGKTVDCVATTRSDVTAPTASILFPPAVSLTEGASVIMRGTVKDEEGGSGVKTVKVNGVSATVDTAKGTWELSAAALTSGANNLKLVVEDVAGNINEDAAQVAVTKGDITQAFPADGGVDFVGPQTVAWDNLGGRNRALVMDVDAKALIAVDLGAGVRSVLSDNKTQLDVPFIFDGKGYNAGSIVLDRQAKKVYAGLSVDITDPNSFLTNSIIGIDLTTGERSFVSESISDETSGLALESNSKEYRLFVGSSKLGDLGAWDLNASQGTQYYSSYSFSVPDTKARFDNVGGVALDTINNQLLFVTLSGELAVFSVDISQPITAPYKERGARKIISDKATPNSDNAFSDAGLYALTSIAFDPASSRALVVDRLKPAIISVSIGGSLEGARSIFSDNANSFNKLSNPYGLHVEADMPYALLVDKAQKALMAVDLVSGERVFISKSK